MKSIATWCLLLSACASSTGTGQSDAGADARSECDDGLHRFTGDACSTEGLSCRQEGVSVCIVTGRCRLPDTCTCAAGHFQCASSEESCTQICGATDAGSDAAVETGAGARCAALPSTAQKQGAGCTGQPGTFKELTFDSTAGTYSESCGIAPYKNQTDFDANEGTSTQAGTTIKSHEDYVLTPSCASGSIDYQPAGSPMSTIVYIWTKVP